MATAFARARARARAAAAIFAAAAFLWAEFGGLGGLGAGGLRAGGLEAGVNRPVLLLRGGVLSMGPANRRSPSVLRVALPSVPDKTDVRYIPERVLTFGHFRAFGGIWQ